MAYVSSATTMRENPSLPECPKCGGPQCLYRPRFFAGQLLTEEDLNRLDDYIVKKNKLHNRYLHGWGVVCGLDVVCNPCVDQSAQVTIKQVTVKAGYALSPCGEDIIVCGDQSVDIGTLIQACRQVQRQINCEPPWPTSSTECQEDEKWVLAICYAEKQSRGITALKGSSASDCGNSKSGCGCQGNSTSKSVYQTSTRSVPAQCEPTLTCEGYSWRVYKAPSKTPPSITRGAMVDCFLECAKPLVAQLEGLPDRLNGSENPEKLYQFCCNFKKTLVEFLVDAGFYNCSIAKELTTIACPGTDWKESIQTLVRLASEFLRHCLCAALLPPCPEPVYDDCVPLATITVQRTNNSIKNICTWDTRRFAITLPNLSYWLSWLPLPRLPFEPLQELCCEPLLDKDKMDFAKLNETFPKAKFGDSQDPYNEFVTLFQDLKNNSSSNRAIDMRNLVLAILGAKALDGKPPFVKKNEEFQNPLQFLLLNQLVKPLLHEVDHLRQPAATLAPSQDLADLRKTVEELQNTVAEQQKTIETLKSSRRRT